MFTWRFHDLPFDFVPHDFLAPTKRYLPMLQVIALKHAKRKGDHEKYPGLEDFNRFKNEPGTVECYLHAKPLEALKYVLSESEGTNLAYNILDKTADNTAVIMCVMQDEAASAWVGAGCGSAQMASTENDRGGGPAPTKARFRRFAGDGERDRFRGGGG